MRSNNCSKKQLEPENINFDQLIKYIEEQQNNYKTVDFTINPFLHIKHIQQISVEINKGMISNESNINKLIELNISSFIFSILIKIVYNVPNNIENVKEISEMSSVYIDLLVYIFN